MEQGHLVERADGGGRGENVLGYERGAQSREAFCRRNYCWRSAGLGQPRVPGQSVLEIAPRPAMREDDQATTQIARAACFWKAVEEAIDQSGEEIAAPRDNGKGRARCCRRVGVNRARYEGLSVHGVLVIVELQVSVRSIEYDPNKKYRQCSLAALPGDRGRGNVDLH